MRKTQQMPAFCDCKKPADGLDHIIDGFNLVAQKNALVRVSDHIINKDEKNEMTLN